MRKILLLAALWSLTVPDLADTLLPPVPEGMDGPPPEAETQDEDLPSLKDLDAFLEGKATPTDLEPGPAKPEKALEAVEKAAPTDTPSPLPAPMKPEPSAPTPTAVPPRPTAVPTTAPEKKSDAVSTKPSERSGTAPKATGAAPAAAPAKPAAASAPADDPATATASNPLAAYFPAQTGKKWTYVYLKGGEEGKKRIVECTEAQTFPNGTIRATFQVTEEGAVTENYSLYNGMVQRTTRDGKTLEGDLAFKLPKKGLPSAWTTGSASSSASFGKAMVFKKTYPDCIVVKEKDGDTVTYRYYARGIGLLSVEVYGAGLKLDLERSFAIVSGPTN